MLRHTVPQKVYFQCPFSEGKCPSEKGCAQEKWRMCSIKMREYEEKRLTWA